ncbi:unnamed protein product [Pleuronectes platessa]|uniref:Uncharacterized protein n=1 Tax=Pleuronectes platessa TaxID=8262 RepID=A0A9N7V3C8_PLEPL|nr:unnamed protein product [Pleuronectes platessa]
MCGVACCLAPRCGMVQEAGLPARWKGRSTRADPVQVEGRVQHRGQLGRLRSRITLRSRKVQGGKAAGGTTRSADASAGASVAEKQLRTLRRPSSYMLQARHDAAGGMHPL